MWNLNSYINFQDDINFVSGTNIKYNGSNVWDFANKTITIDKIIPSVSGNLKIDDGLNDTNVIIN